MTRRMRVGLMAQGPEFVEQVRSHLDGEYELVWMAPVARSSPAIRSLPDPPAQPEIVLLDLDSESFRRRRLWSHLRAGYAQARLLGLVTPPPDRRVLQHALRGGPINLLTKDSARHILADAIRMSRQGMWLVDQMIRDAALEQIRRPVDIASNITPRHRQVLAHMARGLTDREIAHVLRIRTRTVNNHVACIKSRLGVRSRAHAIARAIALGVVQVE